MTDTLLRREDRAKARQLEQEEIIKASALSPLAFAFWKAGKEINNSLVGFSGMARSFEIAAEAIDSFSNIWKRIPLWRRIWFRIYFWISDIWQAVKCSN